MPDTPIFVFPKTEVERKAFAEGYRLACCRAEELIGVGFPVVGERTVWEKLREETKAWTGRRWDDV